MPKSLFFIPDISGYTQFIQKTEIEHSQHVIAELLEVLLEANTEGLQLAEIEGDALFFYKENEIPSQDRLLAQIEAMFQAFYSHLHLLETNRICPCNACKSAPELQLKIVAHSGELQFLEVKGTKKPFGKAVIESHRLLKNSLDSDNYVLISEPLRKSIHLDENYKSSLYNFSKLSDSYDNEIIEYHYSVIDVKNIEIDLLTKPKTVSYSRPPNLLFNFQFPISKELAYEYVTNYRYRKEWTTNVSHFNFKVNEITRLNTEHTCVIGKDHLDFIAVVPEAKENELVYGEYSTSPPPIDELCQLYYFSSIDNETTQLRVEVYWEAKSLIKKLLMFFVGRKTFKKGVENAFLELQNFIEKKKA